MNAAWRNLRDRAGRFLQWSGIEPRAFFALMHAYLLIDFRNQQFGRSMGAKSNEAISPLFWVVGQNLLFSWCLSALLYARVDAFFFTLLALGGSMCIMATALIVEFHEVVLDPEDLDVVGHLPVPVRTYSAARLANLLGYVLLITVSLNLFPTIVGVGQREVGWLYLPAYVAAALVGNVVAAGAVLLVYVVLLRERPTEASREVLAWAQIVLLFITFYGGQMVLRDAQDRLEMAAYQLPAWVAYLPPSWLAHFVLSTGPASPATAVWILALWIVAAAALWTVVLRRLSAAYSRMQPGGTAWRRAALPPLPRPGDLAGRMTAWLTRRGEERTAFWLCSTMLRRDFALRMRSLSLLGMPLAAIALGWCTGQLTDPMDESGPRCVLSLAAVYLLAVPLPTVFHSLSHSRWHEAAWVLTTAPVQDRVAFAEGMRKAVVWRLLLPALAAMTAVFALAWRSPTDVLVHAAAGWLAILAAGHLSQMGVLRQFPFSRPAVRGESFGAIALLASAVSGAAMLLAAIHYAAAQSAIGMVAYLAGLAAVVAGLRLASRWYLARHFATGGRAHE
jgi:hypothetical protein